jgi:phosphoglycerol transferase
LTLLAAAFVLRLWKSDLATPFRYTQLDDTKFYLMLIRSIIRHGWFGAESSLGAPFGQQLADFPQGADNLNFLILRGLAIFTSNPGTVANLFYLLTFPLIGACTFAVLRRLAVATGPAAVAAVLFALLPYHLFRGESQLLLSAYYSVPLSAYLFVCVLLGEPRFQRRAPGERLMVSWLSWRTVRTVVMCAVIASSGLYYAAFGVIILCAAGILALAAGKGRVTAANATGCVLIVCLVLGANLSPSLIYRSEHGANPAITRALTDTELLALKPAQLVLPVQDHRLGILHTINGEYGKATGASYCEQCYETLGTVGDVGFVWLLAAALAAILGAAGLLARSRLYGPASVGVILSLLIASVGGLSSLFAFVVTTDVRGWNRMSLFIAFFSLLAAAALMQGGLQRLRRWRRAAPWAVVVTTAVLVLGVLDETSVDFVPAYSAAGAEYKADVAFFSAVEGRLGPGASVFELPYVPFPEGYGAATSALGFARPNFGTTYEEARGYIASRSLRWSWGGIKGRPTDWEAELAAKPLSTAVAAAALSGFQGLVIEPSGYLLDAQVLMRALQTQLGQSPIVSRYGALWFFDLRAYAARLSSELGAVKARQVRSAALAPLRATCARGGVTVTGGAPLRPVTARFTASILGLEPRLGMLTVHFPDGTSQTVPVRATAARIDRQLVLAGGSRAITFTATNATPSSYAIQVQALTLTPQALEMVEHRGATQIAAGYPAPACNLHPGRP